MRSHAPSRRSVFGAGAAALAAGAIPAEGNGSARGRLDFADPRQRLRAYMMMRGALDGRLVISCINCSYSGVVDGETTPFFDLTAATFARFRPARGGGYEGVSFEIEYFIDRETGDVLHLWRNPYTHEVVEAHHTDSAPMKIVIGSEAKQIFPPALIAGRGFVYDQKPALVIGDDVWIAERFAYVAPPSAPDVKPVRFDETSTFHAKMSDLAAPGRAMARTSTAYVGLSSFRPWQNMGDRPGQMVAQGVGAVGVAISDLPSTWLAATRSRHPQALADPGAYLEPLWRTL